MEKQCNKCGKILPIDRFQKRHSSSGKIVYNNTCRQCVYLNNREIILARGKEKRQTVEHKLKCELSIKLAKERHLSQCAERAKQLYSQETFICNKCSRTLSKDKFQQKKLKSGIIGYYHSCKECRKPLVQKGQLKRKKLHPIYIKVCLHCNKVFGTISKVQKACNQNCLPMTEARKDKAYLKEHPEINRKEYFKEKNKKKFWHNKEYRDQLMSDPDRVIRYKQRAIKFKKEHIIEYRIKKNNYKKKRIANDVDFKLKDHYRKIVYQTLRGIKQYEHSLDLLGCSVIEARNHIERQFKEGMTWDNWGVFGWHIDHIIPIASFDFTKKEDQYRCFHYTNLQPLWWYDNVMKADKIIEKQLMLL